MTKVTSTGKIKDTTLRLRAKFGDDSSQQSVKDGDLTRADYTLEWPSNHMFKRDHCIHMSRVVEIGRGLGNNAPDVLHVRGVRALNHFHILTFSCLNYVERISLISLTHATKKSLEKQGSTAKSNYDENSESFSHFDIFMFQLRQKNITHIAY